MCSSLSFGGSSLFHCLVWPHGMEVAAHVVAIIEESGVGELVHTRIQAKPSMKDLISLVYQHDYAPKDHLSEKLKYLDPIAGDVMHIFFAVDDPRFFLQGKGPFRHYESESVNRIKWQIREAFNPRDASGAMTHDHVVHFSDHPGQVWPVLAALGFRQNQQTTHFFRHTGLGVPIPHHVGEISKLQPVRLKLASLYGRIWDGPQLVSVQLEETPHYRALKENNRSLYEDYVTKHRGHRLKDGQSFNRLERMKDTLASNPVGSIEPIVVTESHPGSYQILDGLHRSSIAHFLEWKDINAAIIRR